MKKRSFGVTLAALVLLQASNKAYSFEAFEVEDIQIKGLQRITEGTVFNYLPVNIGENISNKNSPEILKSLFETGFFQDVKLKRVGKILVIQVTERPTISKITVSGNKDIPDDNLKSTLKQAGLAEGFVLNNSILEQVQNELEQLYFSHGKYAVNVDTVVTERPNNTVSVSIKITEGIAARIKSINIIGNHVYDDKELTKLFSLSASNPLSWVNKSDQYDKQKLSADLENLRTFYLDRGYLNFAIKSTQVSISPDKQDIFVTINIDEGKQYKLRGYQLTGNVILSQKELEEIIKLESGEIFSRTKVANIVKLLTDQLGQYGYAFARVNPVPDLDEQNNTVSLVFYFEPGNLTYVRNITFAGNSKTKDEVLRREIIQMERAPVNTKLIEDSKTRLNRTGFFSDVKVDLQPVSGTTDQVDVLYSVDEASSGQLGGGVGYSDIDGLLFNANVSNRNVMGTGNSMDFNFNHSKAYTTYNMAYNNPYYTKEGVSRGINGFYSKTDLGDVTDISNYTTDAYGANINYGLPISAVDRINYGIGFQSTNLTVGKGGAVPLEISSFTKNNGTRSNELNLALGWNHNTLDRYLFPENGLQQSLGFSISAPGSDLQYFRLTYNIQYFKYLGKDFIFNAKSLLGFGNGYGKTSTLPFYRNFFAGGAKSIRGFDESSLGPKDSLGNPFGGNLLLSGSIGLILPNPGPLKDSKAVRASLFIDGGQVYDTAVKRSFNNPDASRNPNGLRFSTGLSIIWMSPLAPLSFNIAYPLNKDENDKTKVFSFSFGTTM